jgi:hypothetical protein
LAGAATQRTFEGQSVDGNPSRANPSTGQSVEENEMSQGTRKDPPATSIWRRKPVEEIESKLPSETGVGEGAFWAHRDD